MYLDDSWKVVQSDCTCKIGNYKCHHIAAALLYGYKHVSKTDVKCAWLKRPKSGPPKKTQDMEELCPPKQFSALRRAVTDDDRRQMREDLAKLGRFTSMHWVLDSEEPGEPFVVPCVKEALEEFDGTPDGINFMKGVLHMLPSDIERCAKETVGQRTNPNWSKARRHRITASNFGIVLKAVGRGRYPASLFRRLLQEYNLDSKEAVAWGNVHEESAIAQYRTAFGAVVRSTGLWLHSSGCLGASPDGIIDKAAPSVYVFGDASFQPTILEVKCPYSLKDGMARDIVHKKNSCLVEDASGNFKLKKSHEYYDQVQGQIHLTGANAADLVIWTPKDMMVVRVQKDDQWAQNIEKLQNFFFEVFLIHLFCTE